MQFQKVQEDFTKHIRDPDNQPLPEGIEDRRMGIYRELFFNNVEGFVSTGFPVLKSLYEAPQWQSLVREFFIKHSCTSPYFLHIAQEFLLYLADERGLKEEDPPFLLELAHYEWTELEMATRVEVQPFSYLSTQDVTHRPLYFSELAMFVSYQFPVQHISVDFMPEEPGSEQTYLVVYRANEEDVEFLEINVMTAVLLQGILQEPGVQFDALIQHMHHQFPHFTFEQLEQGALQILTQLAERTILRTNTEHN